MRSFFASYWSLTEALDWRCRFEPRISAEAAFGELRELCLAGRVPAIGWRTLDHPRGAKPLPDSYRPFLDPPLRPVDVIEDIPAGEWSDLLPHGDHQLLLKKTRLPVWLGVEIGKELLIAAWLPVIEQSEIPAADQIAKPNKRHVQRGQVNRVANEILEEQKADLVKTNGLLAAAKAIADQIEPVQNSSTIRRYITKKYWELAEKMGIKPSPSRPKIKE